MGVGFLVARWFTWGPNTEEQTRGFLDRAATAAKLGFRCEGSQERFIKGERREVPVDLLLAAGCAA